MKTSLNIPKKLKGPYLEAYINIGNRLISDPKIQTAVLSNSLLNLSPDTNSDLDIIAIINQDFWQREQLSIGGIFIELFLYSKPELFKSFKNGDYQDMHMVAYGFVMFDKKKQIEDIKHKAKEMFEKGPGIPNKEKTDYLKYLVWDNYCDVADIVYKDPLGAYALMQKSVWFAVEVFFVLKGRWFCKPKKFLASVKDLNEGLYSLLKDFCGTDNHDVSACFLLYGKIIERVIFPHSLKDHFVWKGGKHRGTYKLL